jgi:cysteine-rich repeat protein
MIRDRQSGLGFSLVWIAMAIVVAALSGGCDNRKPRTQVMVVVDADDDVSMLAASLVVDIVGTTGGVEEPILSKTFILNEPDSPMWPFSFALVPKGGDAKRTYEITATANGSGVEPIARLRAQSQFVPGKTIELKLRFEASCLREKSLDCEESQTCDKGTCVAALVDAATLKPLGDDSPEVILPDGGSAGTGTTANPNQESGTGGRSGAAGGGGRTAVGIAGSSGGAAGAGTAGSAGAPIGDPSMPANCGDGKLTGDEKCDTAIPAGTGGACPTECMPASVCETTALEGTGCQTVCAPHPITALESGDGCCPAGADGNSDNDCRSQCGNGQIEAGESCDPVEMCPTAATCVSANACLKAVVAGDPTACNATCVMEPIIECVSGDGCCPSNCTRANDNDCSASCGDRVVDPRAGEICEPAGAPSCPTAASCNDNNACTLDLFTGSPNNCNSLCTPIQIPAPLNGDGCCATNVGANANNDSDCQPKCGNNVVERGERCDGRCPAAADCDDGNACTRDELMGSACTAACGHTPITARANGDGCCPAGANMTNDNDCRAVCVNNAVESGEECDGNCGAVDDGNACTSDAAAAACRRPTHTPITSRAAGDGCCQSGDGPTQDADCVGCGNGRKEGAEECDDRNTANGDGCSSTCKNEPPPAVCGNNTKEGTEACDDGNTMSGDGCSSTCQMEAPQPVCPNGTVETGEECDGNCRALNDNDPCTTDVSPGTCKQPTHTPITARIPGDSCCPAGAGPTTDSDCVGCGNGKLDPGETCDEGDVVAGDGCSPTCVIEVQPDAGLLP